MAHNQQDYSKTTIAHISDTEMVTGTMGSAGRRLFLSDNPETVISKSPVVLFADAANLTSGTKKYRAFVWHNNETESQMRLALTLENNGRNAMKITNGVRELAYSKADYVTLGKNNAKACLGATMDAFTAVDTTIAAGATGIIFAASYASGTCMGAIYEFTITGTGSESFVLRTVAIPATSNTTTDNNTIRNTKGTPAALYKRHPRGAWDSCELNATTSQFAITSSSVQKVYNISNGEKDNIFTSRESSDVDNKGHYGVNYKLTIPIANKTSAAKSVSVYVTPRSGAYAGACKYANVIKGIPTLKLNDSNDDAVLIGTVNVPANSAKNFEMTLMHAGGAYLAVGIYVVAK